MGFVSSAKPLIPCSLSLALFRCLASSQLLPSSEEQPSPDLASCHVYGLRKKEYIPHNQQEQSAQ